MKKKGYFVEEVRANGFRQSSVLEPNILNVVDYVVGMLEHINLPFYEFGRNNEFYLFTMSEDSEGNDVMETYAVKKNYKSLEEFLNNMCEIYRKYYGFKILPIPQ